MSNMNLIYKAAVVIQKAITGLATKTSGGTLDNMQVTSSDSDVPAELYSMIHWVNGWTSFQATDRKEIPHR